jgi:hypothetical protein
MNDGALILGRVLFAAAFLVVLFVPAWWLAGRIQEGRISPFLRLLVSIGLALVSYISIVNLIGRATGNSLTAVWTCLAAHAVASAVLWLRRRAELVVTPLFSTWRVWVGPVVLAVMFGLPQWLLAVSTNYWDEAVPSGIYLTAPNQFAEGLFPPRHNAFPEVPIKYHYGFVILSGTVSWLSGWSANVSTDIVSTGLWLFVFLFIYFWLRDLAFGVLPSIWGSVVAMLGGGLSWLYVERLEAYKNGGFVKVPAAADLSHRYDAAKTWFSNVLAAATTPGQHLRNTDGSLSSLPWDIAGQFQQHAVALGTALTPVALYLLITWQKRKELHVPLLLANIATFSMLPLAHAVFGSMAAGTAGVCLLWLWLQERTRVTFFKGLWFGVGMLVLTPLHGGMLAAGEVYGTTAAFTTFRQQLGYAAGGLSGFFHWNVAGFGLLLFLALLAVVLHGWRRDPRQRSQHLLFTALVVFTATSYAIPQVMFYSSDAVAVEEFSEILKFLFCAHLGLALLSVFGLAYLSRRIRPLIVVAGVLMSAVTPVAFCIAHSVDSNGKWTGFYHSPYVGGQTNVEAQMAAVLRREKKSNRDIYFDASADEWRRGYLSGLLIYGGSVFTLTPTAFERNGIGFRLSEQVVARRIAQSSRMMRLAPGAPEESGTTWYYARPDQDMALAPVIVRSRFAKLVREGYFVKKHQVGARVLYSIEKPTSDLDRDIERYWQPRIVAQTKTDWDGNGTTDVLFFDLVDKKIRFGDESVAFPGEVGPFIPAVFPGDARADLLVGRLGDTVYKRGSRFSDVQEYTPWLWSYRDSATRQWQREYMRWLWDWDIPLVADLNHSGIAHHIAYRHRTAEWLAAPDKKLTGPTLPEADLPLPFAGRFITGSASDLGLWSLRTGTVSLRSVSSGQTASFMVGAQPDDILVPGDYDGTGYDQLAVWRRSNRTWRWHRDGLLSEATFGTETSIPVPWDYNHDGRLDLAYWDPDAGKIFVSFNRGRTTDLVVPVPPHSIPAFVYMY